jgi:hypothetical protein
MNNNDIIDAYIGNSRSRVIKYIIDDYRWYLKEISSKRSLKSFCAETSIYLMKRYNISVEDVEKYMLLR